MSKETDDDNGEAGIESSGNEKREFLGIDSVWQSKWKEKRERVTGVPNHLPT